MRARASVVDAHQALERVVRAPEDSFLARSSCRLFSMPQAPREAHRRRVRAGNVAPASLTLNPF